MLALISESGRQFNVRLVRKGERYGLNDCLTHEKDQPMVEFYDASQDSAKFGARGQFISRYYLDTLTGADRFSRGDVRDGGRLCLHGAIPAWDLDGPAAAMAVNWAVAENEKGVQS